MISSDPLVTIVTPSFNQGRFIKATIESVLTQDYKHIEYIIMDGASTDETIEVVKPYLDRLTFVSEPDRGQAHAVNKGFAQANGEIVAWLNSDDLFLPGAIRKAVEAFRAQPKAGVAYGGGFQIDEAGGIKHRFPYTQPHDAWKLIYVSDYILNQSAFFRKAALDAVGPLREELYYIMDWEILMRLALYFDFAFIHDDIGCLREYGTAKTFTGGKKRVREIYKILREYTGMHFPPGTIVYGLDTYQQIWRSQIEEWPSRMNSLKPLAEKIVKKFAHRTIQWASARGQSWRRDRWMGPVAHVMLPQGRGEVLIRGNIPGVKGLKHQILTVRHRRRIVLRRSLQPGPFELRFELPMKAEATPIMDLNWSHRFVFAKLDPTSKDHRTLSAFVEDIRWAQSA